MRIRKASSRSAESSTKTWCRQRSVLRDRQLPPSITMTEVYVLVQTRERRTRTLRRRREERAHGRLWIKCLGCRQTIWKADLEVNLNVCPKCQYHFKINAKQRLDLLLEPGYELVMGDCARPIP